MNISLISCVLKPRFIILVAIALALTYALYSKGFDQVLAYWPLLILLLCPLIHLFMHGGHGHNREDK